MSNRDPELLAPSRIAAALGVAPPSLILGMSVRDARLRERSRYALAEMIADQLAAPTSADPDQLILL